MATPPEQSGFNEAASTIYRAGLGKPRDIIRQETVSGVLGEHLLEMALTRPSGALRILDIGCGSGAQSLKAALEGHEVVGLEPDADMRRLFTTNLAALEDQVSGITERVTLIDNRGEEAPKLFGKDYFDAVFAHGVLGYYEPEQQLTLLDSIREVIRPDGLVSLLNVNGGIAPAVQLALRQEWEAAQEASRSEEEIIERQGVRIQVFTPDDSAILLLAAGFKEVRSYGVRTLTDRYIEEPLEGDTETITQLEILVGNTALQVMSAFVHTICTPDLTYVSHPTYTVR